MRERAYHYRHLPIPGGGYVTGLLYHPTVDGLLYARTDIGGVYRFDREKETWVSLISHVTAKDLSETFPIALAVDGRYPERLYIACGENRPESGVLAVSEDCGDSFHYHKIPVRVHGNLNGRGTGERLFVDEKDSDVLYFASQMEGLWTSCDRGETWRKLAGLPEEYLTFVGQVGSALLVGTAGVTRMKRAAGSWTGHADGAEQPSSESSVPMRGHSLYVSYDKGETFAPLAEPESRRIAGCAVQGLAAQRYCADEKYLYVTFSATGRRSYVAELGYSCDSGDALDGRVVRYELDADGRIGKWTEITPGSVSRAEGAGQNNILDGHMLEYGFSGISVSRQTPGLVAVTTIVKDDGDSIFLSCDYGASWKQILYGLTDGELRFRASYMRPEYNGGTSLIHWLSDFKINPFHEEEAWFNTGTGVFRTKTLTSPVCCFSDWSDGIEETVHLNVYSLPAGKVQVLDILGDLGGFVFEELDRPCENSFADEQGNRYITCINADFSDLHPEVLLVTPRGNWTGKTKGGLILSRDQGKSFARLPMPFGLSEELDEALHRIEQPNVNSGWAALSPDCQRIVWCVADGDGLPVDRIVASADQGQHFTICKFYGLNGEQKHRGRIKVFSDHQESRWFYGFGDGGEFYFSDDGGSTFYEKPLPEQFPKVDFGKIDCADKTEVRGEAGKSGVFYLALGAAGLWKLQYRAETGKAEVCRLTREGDAVYRAGLGLGGPEADYFKDAKAIYFSGEIGGVYGFYRTLDEGQSFERLNTERQMYGEINSIDGDCRTYGRFYLATGSCGLLYGEPEGEII